MHSGMAFQSAHEPTKENKQLPSYQNGVSTVMLMLMLASADADADADADAVGADACCEC